MNKVELLSPAGDMDCLISAVQSGADAVYFGAEQFNARVNGKNFGQEELVKAIEYAKLRNVKTHLTLNILIKNNEFEEALKLVEFAYNSGIDAIIVQDLGLARKIIELFPGLEVHSSTQMTIYNLDGVKEIEKLGFNKICEVVKESPYTFYDGLLTFSKNASRPLFIINSSGSFSSNVIIFTLSPTLSKIGIA